MREIKFRGKRIDNGEWVYGSLTQSEIDVNQLNVVCHIHTRFADCDSLEKIKVIPETVGQLTGKKDNEGKYIYEGDLLEFDKEEWGSDNNIFQVEWDENNAEWSWGGGNTSDMEWRKVIGNVYDNQELIK